jgi:hypothetical protein
VRRRLREWTRGLLAIAHILGMAMLLPTPAQAGMVVLDFEGLSDLEPITNFYNGGTGGLGSGPGPNFGVAFSATSLAVIDSDAGGNGHFAREPSPSTVLVFVDPAGATMNVAAGFGTGVSFFYASVDRAGSVEVYDALGGTGALLASFGLVPHGSACGGDPAGTFNCWAPIGVVFAGTAKSIKFLGVANRIAFDDVTFGSEIPGPRLPTPATPGQQVPAPATLILLSAGLSLAAVRLRRAE